MKKPVIAFVLVAAVCAWLLFAFAEADSFDVSGRWQDPANDRALLKIMRTHEVDDPDGGLWYDVELSWPDSADTRTVWYMTARFDDGTQRLVYTDGVKAVETYGGDGSLTREEKLWEDAEGALVPEDGMLRWTDSREDPLRADAGETSLLFRRVPRTAPDTEAFLSEYFTMVANMEEGTAGSSLKQAEAARDIVRFALQNDLWDADRQAMRQNMASAWASMDEGDRDGFGGNLHDIFMPLLESAFGNYGEVAGSFDDAGVGEDMAWLAENREARSSWETLLAETLTLTQRQGAA